MDIQKIIADAQRQADANGDGKLSVADIDDLAKKHGVDPKMLDDLKKKADTNGDGKIDVKDIQSSVGDLGGMVNDLKDKFFGDKK